MTMKTFSLKKENVERQWYVIDASDKILGRVATKIADRIRGKDKPTFTPHTDGGDYVVVINADKIKVTGAKFTDKKYYTHSLYPGGLKTTNPSTLMNKKPEEILKMAVKRMLPGGPLAKKQLSKLKMYKGKSHPHDVQNPKIIDFAMLNSKNKISIN